MNLIFSPQAALLEDQSGWCPEKLAEGPPGPFQRLVGRCRDLVWFKVEIASAEASVSSAQFADFRSILRVKLKMYANAEKQMPELVSKGNHELSEEFGADLNIEFAIALSVSSPRRDLVLWGGTFK